MITTLTDALKGILGLNKQISEKDIECAIDEQTVECAEMDEEPAYTGIPAPILTPVDDWFPVHKGVLLKNNKIIWHKKQRSRNKKQRIVSIGRKNLLTSIKRCMR